MKIIKLEAIRGFAAIYVVLFHLISFTDLRDAVGPFIRFPFRFGQEAVILFFLMSGFVIALNVKKQKDLKFSSYFMRRFVRIYPLAIASFVISFVVLKLNGGHLVPSDYITLLGNFLMLQESDKPGLIVPAFLENHPLWSLSYEWWFYMMFFPMFIWFRKVKDRLSFPKIYVVLLLSATAWILFIFIPNHLLLVVSYFTMWWAGVDCADMYMEKKDFTLKDMLPIFYSLSIMTVLMMIPIITSLMEGNRSFKSIAYPIIPFRHYAFALLSLLVALGWWKIKMKNFDLIFKSSAKLAPISYALYIIHVPFIWLELPYFTNIYVISAIKLLLIFSFSYLLEIKLQPIIGNLMFKKKEVRLSGRTSSL